MYIMGIHDGHNSGATLIKDGKVLASVCEERLTRVKNEVGFPKNSIREILALENLTIENIDHFVFASEYNHSNEKLKNKNIWYKVGADEQAKDQKQTKKQLRENLILRQQQRCEQLNLQFNAPLEKMSFKEHHESHAAAAYFGSHYSANEEVLVITCDGAGDRLCATVSIAKDGKLKRLLSTDRNASLGKIYSRVTFYLGLTPWEHEYKVMGLAPYADQKYAIEICEILDRYLGLTKDGLSFEQKTDVEPHYLYETFRNDFELKRFDAISGGVQMFTERLLCEWVANLVSHFGISKLACGGGVFMNVKANKLLSELDGVEDIFVCPSCGDESLSIGAAWLKHFESIKIEDVNGKLPSLDNLYLGRGYSNLEIEREILKQDDGWYTFEYHDDIERRIASLLSSNEIVARFAGRMEWGARALGNRSILTNPQEWPSVERINSMIKMRDFWMPFAPSMVADQAEMLIVNPKNIASPHMMFAFDTTAFGVQKIAAATHPRDKTARAQLVLEETNPKYYKLINNFFNLTGIPCVLNTSFNLHGYPLVMSPMDAINVFKNSGLTNLALENYLLKKL